MKYFFIKKTTLINIILILVLHSCFTDVKIDNSKEEMLAQNKYNLKTIVTSNNHIGFSKLIYYNNTWFIAYREADSHVNQGDQSTSSTSYSKIVVLKSIDFINWSVINTFSNQPGWDLRGGVFSHDEVKDSLYLHIPVTNLKTKDLAYGSKKENYYAVYNKNNNKFNDILNFQPITQNYPEDFLYYPLWYKGEMYVTGYSWTGVRYYKYTNLTKTPLFFAEIKETNKGEGAIYFFKDSLYTLVRTPTDAIFAKLKMSGNDLSKLETSTHGEFEKKYFPAYFDIGGPEIVIENDIVYMGGRENSSKNPIYKLLLNTDKLILLTYLPVYGWDNSYPGFVLKDNYLYGTYYTENEYGSGFEIRTFVIPLSY